MKLLVLLTFYLSLVAADSSSTQDVKPKPTAKTLNSLPVSTKQEYYQPQYQPQQQHYQPQYVQIIPKPVYIHQQPQQQQPQAHMIIIAQPAYLPANVVYGGATQQLLNYFHNNPQARYQLLHGNYQQVQQQPQHYIQPAQTIGNYQFVAAPVQYQPNIVPSSSNHIPFTQTSPLQHPQISGQYSSSQQQPLQLSQIAQLAQTAAQQYLHTPIRSTPAIITGFENFTPDQQAKIKAQLTAHFGTQLTPLQNQQQPTKAPNYITHAPSQYSRYQQQQDFVPSPQIKNDVGSSSEGLKSQYSKM